jgi:hypothetical protein
MQTLFYPGYANEPAQVDYGISFRKDSPAAGVDVIVVHSKRLGLPTASLIARHDSRDRVLNLILSKELAATRVDQMRFFVLFDTQDLGHTLGFEFPIELDFEDYKERGNPYQIDRPLPAAWLGRVIWAIGYRPPRYWTRDEDVVAGCANFRTNFDGRRHLAFEEVTSLCESVGHVAIGKSLPKWLKDSVTIKKS